jgi:GTP-binding protein
VAAVVKKFLAALGEHWAELPPHFVTSAVKFRGRKELLSFIENLNSIVKTNQTN